MNIENEKKREELTRLPCTHNQRHTIIGDLAPTKYSGASRGATKRAEAQNLRRQKKARQQTNDYPPWSGGRMATASLSRATKSCLASRPRG